MWRLYAIVASILWGLDYSLTEKALEKIRLPTLLAVELAVGFVCMIALSLVSGNFKRDVMTLVNARSDLVVVALIVIAFNVANALIVLSIGSKNAALAGIIEISYPLFIVLFSWLLFKEGSLSLSTIVGGALILTGVCLIFVLN